MLLNGTLAKDVTGLWSLIAIHDGSRWLRLPVRGCSGQIMVFFPQHVLKMTGLTCGNI